MNVEYLTIHPQKQSNTNDEIESLLVNLNSALNSNNFDKKRVVRTTVFYTPSIGHSNLLQLKNATFNYFHPNTPAISFLAQPPLAKSKRNLAIEIWFCSNPESNITFKQYNNISYSIIHSATEQNLIISGLQDLTEGLSIQQQAESAFNSLETILRLEGYLFTDIIRQWNYIEDILNTRDDEQNYQVFNDIRTSYYNKHGLNQNFPAATGIGIQDGGVIVEIHAVKKNNELQIADIKNPLQTEAFQYSEEVLEGKATSGQPNKTTPKFSRAKLLINKNNATILVSGTASIHGEETIGIDDINKQTEITIQNIEQLTSGKALPDVNLNDLITDYARVYVKNKKDYRIVKDICKKQLPCTNTILVEADICRDNLLVEIETIAHLCVSRS